MGERVTRGVEVRGERNVVGERSMVAVVTWDMWWWSRTVRVCSIGLTVLGNRSTSVTVAPPPP